MWSGVLQKEGAVKPDGQDGGMVFMLGLHDGGMWWCLLRSLSAFPVFFRKSLALKVLYARDLGVWG